MIARSWLLAFSTSSPQTDKKIGDKKIPMAACL